MAYAWGYHEGVMRATESVSRNLSKPPKLHGRYLICRLLGKGAQARVYLAYDTRLRQWRAAKVLAPNFLDDEHVRARFEQEARAMAKLSHPSLLRVVDIDQDGRTPFMIMELARGGAVTDWIKRHGPVPPVLACRVTQRACDGLGHAHMTGVIHRDVKPHNLLIREDGSVVLTDFGIAHVEEDEHHLTATGTIMGTFAFMAPEQRSDAKSVDARADVYSLGATLYTMLTGRTSPELFFAESRDNLLDGVPEALRPIILTACRYEREQRFANMADFHAAIERKIQKLPKDPGSPHLATALLSLPDAPPQWLEPDSGVEELSKALLAEVEELPTVVPSALRDDYTTSGPRSIPTPKSGARPAASTTWGGPNSSLAGPPPERLSSGATDPGSRNARANTTWSERFDASYIDPGTVEAPLPAPSKPASAPVTIKPPEPSRSSLSIGALVRRSPSVTAITALSTVLLVMLLLGSIGGIAVKAMASRRMSEASRSLVLIANEEASVVSDLVAAGASESKLQERWSQFQEASTAAQPAAASAFVEAVELEAERVHMTGLPMSHVAQLGRARREWEDAARHREWAAHFLPSRLTGTLALW